MLVTTRGQVLFSYQDAKNAIKAMEKADKNHRIKYGYGNLSTLLRRKAAAVDDKGTFYWETVALDKIERYDLRKMQEKVVKQLQKWFEADDT